MRRPAGERLRSALDAGYMGEMSNRSKGASTEGIGTTEAVFHLVNGILGVGVLGYPFAFKECGALLGSIIIFTILFICLFSVQLLLISSQLTGKKTFEDLAAFTFGKTGQRAVRFSILILNLGAMVAYMNVIADVLSSVAGTVVPPGAEPSRDSVILAVTVFGILPMALFIQDASSMACVSTFTVGFIFLFAFLVLIWGLTPSPSAGKIVIWNTKGILVAFPVMAYGFTIHTILFPVLALLRAPSNKKMSQAVSQGMLVCCLVYMAVGFGGYMAYGQRVSGDILRSLGSLELVGMRGVYERILKVGYGLNILGTVPLVILPTHSLLIPMTTNCFGGRDGKSCGLETHKKIISTAIVGIACGLAMILPNVGFILGLNGATSGILLAYIMPSLIYLKVTNMSHGSQSKLTDRNSSQWIWRRRKAVLLLLFGISAGAICTTATLRAVHEENEVVQLAQELVERGKTVEEASAVEKKAKDVSITVDVVHNATENLGDVEGDAAASLQAIQDTAAVLNATISKDEEPATVALWDVAKKFEKRNKQQAERKTLDGVIDNLNAVRAHLRGTLVTLSNIKENLDNALEQVKSHNETKGDSATAEDDAVGKQIGDIVEELKSALGVSIKTTAGETSSESTLTQLISEVMAAMVAIKETLKILTEVEEVIVEAKERGTGDAQLKKEAVDAMYRAVNATASSALALQMTNQALHQAATNQTSEVLDVLTTVVSDKKENPTTTWAFQEAVLLTKEGKDVMLQFGGEKIVQTDQTKSSNRPSSQSSEDDDGKEKAEAVIQQISGIQNKGEGEDKGEGEPANLSTLAEAAKAAVNITEGSKKHAIKHQQAAVDTVNPNVAAKAEEIVKELENKPGTNGTLDSSKEKEKIDNTKGVQQHQESHSQNRMKRRNNGANARRQGGNWKTLFRRFV